MENKLQPEEIALIKDFKAKTDDLIISFGETEFEIQLLTLRKQQLQNALNELKLNQDKFSKQIFAKYGTVRINFETGDILKIE